MTLFFWRQLRLGIIPLLLLAIALASCGGDDDGTGDNGKVKVITTLPLFADFVRQIGGDRVEVTSLLPAGADPHTFEPSPRDIEPVTGADIAFANGLDLEPGLINVLEANLSDGTELVMLANEAIAESVRPPTPTGDVEVIAATDPHLWMETRNAILYGKVIQRSLTDLDAGSEDTYEDNFERYEAALNELRDHMLEKVDAVPQENRKLVTTHEAFFWFAHNIAFEAAAFVAQSPGQEPSPQDIANLRAALEDQNIPAVFTEPQINEESAILEQAAEDAGVQVCTLYSDSLDDEVSSYIEMMRFNADELARCLGGDG